MRAMENVWKLFDNAPRKESFPLASYLFDLARYEAKEADSLTFHNVGQITQTRCGFKYAIFYNKKKKEELEDQLKAFNLTLVKNARGNQYIRTIHMLSGAVYLKAAQAIYKNSIPIEKWITPTGELPKSIIQSIKTYIKEDPNIALDVADFFRRLKEHFEKFNTPPTVEVCFRDENILSRKMLTRILGAIWPEDENRPEAEHHQSMSDTRPLLALDNQLRLVVKFPGTRPKFDMERNVSQVRFVFRQADGGARAIAVFRRESNGWRMAGNPELECGIPVDEFVSIKRQVWQKNAKTADESQTIDVTPSVLRNVETDHVLLRLDGPSRDEQPPSVLHPMGAGATIVADQWYFASTLHSAKPSAAIVRNEKEETLSLQEPFQFRTSDGIPDGIRIGETVYPVATKAMDWIWVDPTCCRWTGLRLFCERDKIPFFKEKDVSVWYRTNNENEYNLPLDEDSPSWEKILWNRGWIVFRDATTKKEITKRPLTFIPKVDCTEILRSFDLNEEADVVIRFKNESVPVHIPPWKRTILLPDIHGFSGFKFPLNRKGSSFHISGADFVIPLSKESTRPTMIAREDFDEAIFEVISPSDGEVTIDNGFSDETMPHDNLIGRVIQEKLNSPEAKNWRMTVGNGGDSYYWQVYEPEKTTAPSNSFHPVHWARQNDDLFIQFWVAHRWRNHSLSFLFYPAHKQDEKPQKWPREKNPNEIETNFETQKNGRLLVTMRVKSLYADPSVEWGCGLLAFVGFEEGNHYHPVSSGFFLKAENAEAFQACNDDPYGLRIAIARSDLPAIERIMQTDNEEAREWIRRFEERTLRSLYLMRKFEAFHAYRSHCIEANGRESPSGYYFMAGWLMLEKMQENARKEWKNSASNNIQATDNKELAITLCVLSDMRSGKLPENYRGKWSSLLIADRFFVPEAFFPSESAKKMAKNAILAQRATVARGELVKNQERTGNLDSGHQRYWTSCLAFNDVPHATKRLISLLQNSECSLPSPDSFTDRTFCHFGGNFMNEDRHLRAETADTLERFISRLAFGVAQWRKSPTLEGAQILRDLLLEVQAIDHELRESLPDTFENGSDAPKIWRPKHTLLERIAFKADIFAQSLSESLTDENPQP